jgi:hypothetical protein
VDPESVHALTTLLDSDPISGMLGGVCCRKEERMRIAVALVAVVIACGAAALRAQDATSTGRARQLLRACEAGPGPADPLSALKAECRSACNRYLEQIGKLDSRLLGPFLRNCEDKYASLGEYQKGELYREGYHFSSLVPPQPLTVPAGSHQVVLFTSLACPGCMAERAQLIEWSASPWARSKSVIAVLQPLTGGYSPSSGFDYDAYALVDIACEDLPPALATKVRNMATETRVTMPLRSPEDARALLIRASVEPAQVEKFMGSFSIQSRLRKAQLEAQRSRVVSPRTYVVNGKYVVPAVAKDGAAVMTNAAYLNVVQFLIQRDAGEIGQVRK